MPKKIAYIYKSEYPFEIRIQKICESLANNGYDLTVICKWNKEDIIQDEINGVKVIRVGKDKNLKLLKPMPNNPYWKSALKSILTSLKPDLIINREIFLMTEVVPIAKKLNIPVIIDMAENYPAAIKNFRNYNNSFLKRLIFNKIKLLNKLEKYSVKNADGIILVCDENRDRLIEQFKYDANNTSIVHNTPIKDWFNEEISFNPHPTVFNYMGYVSKERNLENFIKGFDLYCEKTGKDIVFDIYGSGTELQHLKNITKNLKHRDKIHFFGHYAHNDMGKFINQADIGVLPYINDEFINTTISNKMFDYMAVGKPVICSNAKPMIRIIEETGCGVYSDCSTPEKCAEAIELILKNYNIGMHKNALKAFQTKYNWDADEAVLLKFVGKYLNGRI